ncbi:MAG: hypothetical protein GC200_12495 [Tepidisphaera sp.]|nr:hypothetical protein [Tepidisphaera sp.]
MRNSKLSEQRATARKRRSDAITWRLTGADAPRGAWLLDSSAEGLAFAYRGERVPGVDAIIDVCPDPEHSPEVFQAARVRRVTRVHGDLMVIGAEVWRTSAFPPAASERVEAKGPPPAKPMLDLRPFDLDDVMTRASELRKNAWWRSGG